MKAAVFREFSKDPTKVVNIEDIDMPKLKPNEVMIKNEAAAYNYNDLWAIWGEPIKVPTPHISGSDVAGTVVEAGEEQEGATRQRGGDPCLRGVMRGGVDPGEPDRQVGEADLVLESARLPADRSGGVPGEDGVERRGDHTGPAQPDVEDPAESLLVKGSRGIRTGRVPADQGE